MSIKWKIVLSSLVTAFIVVLGMGIVSLKISQDTLEKRAIEFMTGILERNAYEVTQQFTSVEKVVSATFLDVTSTYNVEKSLYHPEYIQSYMAKMKTNIKLAAELDVSSSAYLLFLESGDNVTIGQGIYFTDQNHDGNLEEQKIPSWMSQKWLNALAQQSKSQNSIQWETLLDADYLHCYEVYYKNDKPIALVGADLQRDLLKNKLRLAKYLNSGKLYLTNEKSIILYHSELGDGSNFNTGLSKIEKTDTKTNEISIENHFEKTLDINMKRIVRGQMTLQNGWHIGMEVQLVDIYEGLDQLQYLILFFMLVTMLIALTMGIYLGNVIGKPYIHIASQIESIDSNQYEVHLDQSYGQRKDEAGVLTRSLLKMIERQQKSFEEIHRYNHNLEALVDERTNALYQTNEELEEALSVSQEKQAMLIEANSQLEISLETIEKTQQELLKAEKLASLGYLVSGISHQINTPLGNSITSVSYLKRELQMIEKKFFQGVLTKNEFGEFIESMQEGLNTVYGNLQKSSLLIDKFKATAVVSSSEEIVPVHLKSTFQDWIYLLQTQFHAQSVTIELDIPDQLIFHCRPSSLKRLVDELLTNAIEHAFEAIDNPDILIRATWLETGLPGISLTIVDNGVGVSQEDQQHLFTPFYTTKMGRNHDGLGLNMVYNLVLGVFKGDISIETNSMEGLSVSILLYEEIL